MLAAPRQLMRSMLDTGPDTLQIQAPPLHTVSYVAPPWACTSGLPGPPMGKKLLTSRSSEHAEPAVQGMRLRLGPAASHAAPLWA